MPFVSKPKSKRSKKSNKISRPRRGYKTVNIVKRSLNPLPQRFITTMKYSETVSLTAVTLSSYTFNLNSIFDPNRTGVGHQPYGHDTLQSLYNRYRVIGCHYVIQCPIASNTIQFGCVPTNEVVVPYAGGIDELKENPRAKFAVQMSGGTPRTIKGFVSIPSLVGRTKSQYMADDRYQGVFGASPAELAILNVQAANTAGGSVDCPLLVTLKYVVECFDIKTLAQS